MKKSKIRVLAVLVAGIMMFSAVPVSAAELSTPEKEIETEETQTTSGSFTKKLDYGSIHVKITCTYTASWDEGIAGWINSAGFSWSDAYNGNTVCSCETSGTSWTSGSSAYQKYLIDGSLYKVVLTIDEWGDVTLSMVAG